MSLSHNVLQNFRWAYLHQQQMRCHLGERILAISTLSEGPTLEEIGYVFVTVWHRMTRRHMLGLKLMQRTEAADRREMHLPLMRKGTLPRVL